MLFTKFLLCSIRRLNPSVRLNNKRFDPVVSEHIKILFYREILKFLERNIDMAWYTSKFHIFKLYYMK